MKGSHDRWWLLPLCILNTAIHYWETPEFKPPMR